MVVRLPVFGLSGITSQMIIFILKVNFLSIMELIPSSFVDNTLESYLPAISTRSRIIYWIITAIVISIISLLPLIQIDVSVQAPGFFQSDIGKQVIYAPFQGKVLTTRVRSGNRVNKGDTLLLIDSEAIKAHYDALERRREETKTFIRDLEILTGINSATDSNLTGILLTGRYRAEFAHLQSRSSIQLQKLLKRRTEHQRNQLLFNKEIIPETDYENSLFMLDSEKDNLDQIMIYQRSLWHTDLVSRQNELIDLLAGIRQCKADLSSRVVLAPVSGEIIQSSDIQAGSVVSQGQRLAEISPDGELVAACYVKPSDIGLIRENQRVRIQVDAFNHNEWGMLNGRVVEISDDVILENGSAAFFSIRCRPDTTFLSLKDGRKAFIRKGMSLNARIVIIRRSLFNLLFDKTEKWFSPYDYKNY
jgi:membrane fusion protein, peptide pheromone/bacteriocin exporter